MMKNLNFLTKASFRLLALILCLAASIPQMRADTYTVAGTANGVLGTSNDWNVTAEANDMVQYEENTDYYYLIKSGNLTNQTGGWYGFKIVTNHSWGNASYPSDNYYYNVPSDGTYTCVFAFNTNGNSVSLTGPFQTLTAVGDDTNALGSSWTPSDRNNDMTSNDGGITYHLLKSNVTYTSGGNHECKVATNHVWDHDGLDMAYPLSGNNETYNIPSAGTYDVEFIFNTITQELTVNPTPLTPAADSYVVAGVSSVFGSDWDGTASANTMTQGNDGTYTLTLSNVALTASTNYEYKIVKNGSLWIPDGDNLTFSVPLNGSYNVTFTFDSSTNTCVVTYDLQTATGGETYTVAGSNTTILSSEWDQSDTNNDMTLVDGVYQLTFNDVVLSDNNPSCEFRVVVNHSWLTAYPVGNATVTGFNGSGTYDIVFTYNPSTNAVTGVATKLVNYYVVGDEALMGIDWDATLSDDALMSGNNGTYTWSKQGIHLNMGTYNLKVKDSDGNCMATAIITM